MTRRSLPLGIAVLVLIVAACSDDSGSEESRGSAGDSTVSSALGQLPGSADVDSSLVYAADLERAMGAGDIERPDDTAADDVFPWTAALTGAGTAEEPARVFVPLPDLLRPDATDPAEMDELAGWSVLDVDTFVAQTTPPETMTVVSGDLDLSDDLPEVEDGIVTDVEGEDNEPDLESGGLNRLGIPTRMAEDGDWVAASSSTDLIRDWVDEEESLADANGDYADLAEALDQEGVYSAVLSGVAGGLDASVVLGGQLDPEEAEEQLREVQESLPDDPFDAVGIGWADDGGEPLVVTAYHFGSADAAESATEPLRELYESGTSVRTRAPYSDYFEVQDVAAEGEVVVVTSHLPDDATIGTAYEMLLSRELIFTSP
jgi:hypothetical protein